VSAARTHPYHQSRHPKNPPAMSNMFGWVFGSGNTAKRKDAPKKAIIDLRAQLDLLEKKEKHIEGQISEQEGVAKGNVSSNKKKALTALRRKKMYEGYLEKLQAQVNTIEQQLHTIESANLNFETMKVMEGGSKAMKTIHSGMNIDKVDKVMDDIQEQQQLAEEVADAVARPLGETLDEEELNEELRQLEQEDLDERILKVDATPVSAPITNGRVSAQPVQAEEEDEEEELRRLQAEMAM